MATAKAENITAKNKQVAKIGDTIVLVLPDAHQQPQRCSAILVALNAEIEKGNGRYVLEKNLHALPICTIADVEVVSQSDQKPIEFRAPKNLEGLRLDGPTIVEFVAAGYKPSEYPPPGYAEVLLPVEQEAAREAVAAIRRVAYAPKDESAKPADTTAPVTEAAKAPAESQEQKPVAEEPTGD